jgi:hypothetical protein
VTEPRAHTDHPDAVASDLVEYLIVAVPDLDALGALAAALIEMVESAAIRVLDLIVLVKDREGVVTALELDTVESMAPLRDMAFDRMLSEHDLGLASLALRPGTTGVVLVTEDRWAAPLSAAAQHAGGQIVGGERIPASRIEAALAEHHEVDTREG